MDRTTKLLLAAIAIGLFTNAGVNAMRPADAQSHIPPYSYQTGNNLDRIAAAITDIAAGNCQNDKIC